MTDLWLEEHCQVHCFNLVNSVYILDYYELVRHQILFHWSGVKPEAEPVIRGRCFVRSGAVFCVWLPLTALHTCAGCPGQARNHQNLSRCWCPGPWLLSVLGDRQCTERLPSSRRPQTVLDIGKTWLCDRRSHRERSHISHSVPGENWSEWVQGQICPVLSSVSHPSHSQHCTVQFLQAAS